jgi:porin
MESLDRRSLDAIYPRWLRKRWRQFAAKIHQHRFSYQTVPGGNQLGVSFNWGEPNVSTFEPGLRDQSSVELFYRIQLFKELAITPDVQYIKHPALNPAEDSLWVFGLRVRLAF